MTAKGSPKRDGTTPQPSTSSAHDGGLIPGGGGSLNLAGSLLLTHRWSPVPSCPAASFSAASCSTGPAGRTRGRRCSNSAAGGAHGSSAWAPDAVSLRIAVPLARMVLAQKGELVDQLGARCRHWSGRIPGEGGRAVLDGGREPLGGDYKSRRRTPRSCP